MLDVKYLLLALWSWIVDHGLTLAALAIVGLLIPRAGRLVVRIITERIAHGDEQSKAHLAFVGTLVYLLEIVAYFFLAYSALTNLGVSAVGAAVPATVVSAAIGFGAQKVIADFLAGFFIISEHQYGVGDIVAFDGTSDKVKGTVVKLTLRATQIRTGNGELITLPNSQADITINSSQEWSRAVVDLELPMIRDDTMSSLADTVSVVTQRAIDLGGVRDEIIGEVSVLPAMSINPPTAAGLPWTVGIQVTADVNPATQWKVQRIIRAALVNEFWDRFQAPGILPSQHSSGPPTQAFPPVDALSGAAATADPGHAVEDGEPRPLAETGVPENRRHTEETQDARVDQDAQVGHDAQVNQDAQETESTEDAAGTAQDADTPAPRRGSSIEEIAADVAEHGIWRTQQPGSRLSRIITVGGRIRPSSGILIVLIAVLAVIGLLAADPDGGNSGPIAPARWSPVSTPPATGVVSPSAPSAPAAPSATPVPDATTPAHSTLSPSTVPGAGTDSSSTGEDADLTAPTTESAPGVLGDRTGRQSTTTPGTGATGVQDDSTPTTTQP